VYSTGRKVEDDGAAAVEFHAARDPGAEQTDQRRFDNMLSIDKIVAVGFIQRGVDAPAETRQYHQLDIFILQEDSLIRLINFVRG
jgi:hypothetical protein